MTQDTASGMHQHAVLHIIAPQVCISSVKDGIFAIRRSDTTNDARYRKRYASTRSVVYLPFGWIARLPSPSRLRRATSPKVRGYLTFPSPLGSETKPRVLNESPVDSQTPRCPSPQTRRVDCEARRMRSPLARITQPHPAFALLSPPSPRGKGCKVDSVKELYIILHFAF